MRASNVKDDHINDMDVDDECGDANVVEAAFGSGDLDQNNVTLDALSFPNCPLWGYKYDKLLNDDFAIFQKNSYKFV